MARVHKRRGFYVAKRRRKEGKQERGEPFWFPPGRFVSGNVHHLLDGHGVENGMGCRLAAVGFVDAFHDGVALALAGGHDDQQFAFAGERGAAEGVVFFAAQDVAADYGAAPGAGGFGYSCQRLQRRLLIL